MGCLLFMLVFFSVDCFELVCQNLRLRGKTRYRNDDALLDVNLRHPCSPQYRHMTGIIAVPVLSDNPDTAVPPRRNDRPPTAFM